MVDIKHYKKLLFNEETGKERYSLVQKEAEKIYAENRKLPLKLVKLETMEQAQSAPTPATIFSLFYNGKFVTTDLSCCLDSRFDKTVKF